MARLQIVILAVAIGACLAEKRWFEPFLHVSDDQYAKKDNMRNALVRFGKRTDEAVKKQDDGDMRNALVRFGKRSDSMRNALVRFGKRDDNMRNALVRFGKRSDMPAMRQGLVRFGRDSNNMDLFNRWVAATLGDSDVQKPRFG